jgi:DNA invertase Pin-like site-specific DNA recombinase
VLFEITANTAALESQEEVGVRAALYLRVSTKDQDTSNQEIELRAAAARMGHEIVATFTDNGVSGAKSRDKRPGFDKLHKARREFDLVMAWSVDRLGRSLQDLVALLMELRATNTGLYLHQQGLDTNTPAGRMLYQVLGTFAEFEREIIRERVNAGLARARARGTKSGKAIGRPVEVGQAKVAAIREARAKGNRSLRELAKHFDVGVSTVRRALAQ